MISLLFEYMGKVQKRSDDVSCVVVYGQLVFSMNRSRYESF